MIEKRQTLPFDLFFSPRISCWRTLEEWMLGAFGCIMGIAASQERGTALPVECEAMQQEILSAGFSSTSTKQRQLQAKGSTTQNLNKWKIRREHLKPKCSLIVLLPANHLVEQQHHQQSQALVDKSHPALGFHLQVEHFDKHLLICLAAQQVNTPALMLSKELN